MQRQGLLKGDPFASLSELYFTFIRFILLVQMKKVISMNYDTWYLQWEM